MPNVPSESSQQAAPGPEAATTGATPPCAGPPGSARFARACGALWVVMSLGVCGWLLARLTGFDYGLDQGIYAVVADVMWWGGAPYRDAWDFKPPGIFFAYAAARAVFGDAMNSVRWLEAAGLVSLIAASAVYARRFAGSVWPGLLGGALAVSGHVWMGFWHTAQPESFGVVLIAWALVLATTPAATARERWLQSLGHAAAGAAYALAALLKPPLGGGILVSFAFAARLAAREAPPGARVRAILRPGLAFGLGAAAPLLAALAWFAAKGATGDLYQALFVFAPGYTAINYRSGDLPGFALRSVEILLLRFSWLNPLGLALLFALPRLAPREREGFLHVLGVMGVCLAGVALQGRFFAYHYGAVVPLLALVAGWGLWKLTLVRFGRRFAMGSIALGAALFLLANANGLAGRNPGGLLARIRTLDAGNAYTAPQRRVAAWLRAHTRDGDAIHVFGFQPMVYDLADRRPASRFIYNAPQRAPWFAERGRDLLMRELREDPPAAILIEHGDAHPGTAGTDLDSAATLERFPRLALFLARHYDEGERVEAFTIHLRKAAGPSPPPATATPTPPAATAPATPTPREPRELPSDME
jgi:hypothetical protein